VSTARHYLSLFFYASSATRELHSFPTRRSSDLIAKLKVFRIALSQLAELYGVNLQPEEINLFSVSSQWSKSTEEAHNNLLRNTRSEEHTSELQSRENLVCRLLLEKKNSTEDNIV